MNLRDPKIYIVGAGVSGLVAALNLEKKGYKPVIIEATNRVGGRVKTDIVDGYQLDRGFQVLLSSYPVAKKYLNYKELNLQAFNSGSDIFSHGEKKRIGDPSRDISMLIPTLFSGVGSLGDKFRMLRLKLKLQL